MQTSNQRTQTTTSHNPIKSFPPLSAASFGGKAAFINFPFEKFSEVFQTSQQLAAAAAYKGDETVNDITKKGQMILLCLKQNRQNHMTAEDIAEALKNEHAAVSAATIYRQLDKLVSAGLVRKYVSSPEEPACFQFADNTSAACASHFHLKCTSCGKLFHVTCPYLDRIETHILSHHGFAVDNTRTVLYGICESCRAFTSNQRIRLSDELHCHKDDLHRHEEDDLHET